MFGWEQRWLREVIGCKAGVICSGEEFPVTVPKTKALWNVLHTPAACVPPSPLLSVSVAVAIVAVVVTMVPLTEMAVDRIFWAGKARFWDSGFEVTSPQWLLMCPCGLIWVGTSTVPINQDQVGLTAMADYDVNGGRWEGGANWQQCVCFLTSRIYASERFLFTQKKLIVLN